jgi:hypothetical protein
MFHERARLSEPADTLKEVKNAKSSRHAALGALDRSDVWVRMHRSIDPTGPSIVRRGRFAVVGEHGPQVVDEAGVAIVTIVERDVVTPTNRGVRVDLRPSFRIEISTRPFSLEPPHDDAAVGFDWATRDLAAEMEASFRGALLMRPDPNHGASVRAQHRVAPIEAASLRDHSVRFAVDHASVTLHPEGEAAIRLTCIQSTVRGVRQYVEHFQTPEGPRYPATAAAIERLAADMRAFLSGRHGHFTKCPSASRHDGPVEKHPS